MTSQIDTSDQNALKSLVRGTIHSPGCDGYDEARQVWNGMIDRRPAAIVCAAGVSDVMATVRFAGERGLPGCDPVRRPQRGGNRAMDRFATRLA